MALPQSLITALDELVRSDFLSLRDSYFDWLLISTGVVVMGVVLEELGEWDAIARRCGKKITKIGWLLIIAGVIGEGVFEGLVAKADGLAQTFNTSLLTAAQKEAGFAIERAAQLRVDLENSKADTKTAQTRLEVEQRKTAEAQQKAAVAQLELKKALEQVSLRQESRSFDSEAFLRVMKGNPTGYVDVIYTPGFWEAYRFAGQIFAAIERADGWVVTAPKPIPEGVGEKTINSPTVPVPARFSGTGSRCGITLLVPGGTRDSLVDTREHTALWALVHGLEQGCLPIGAFGVSEESSLPLAPGHFVIVVSPKE